MGRLASALRDRVLRQVATAARVEGQTPMTTVSGDWFPARLIAAPAPERDYENGRRVVRERGELVAGPAGVDVRPSDRLEIDSPLLGTATWNVVGLPERVGRGPRVRAVIVPVERVTEPTAKGGTRRERAAQPRQVHRACAAGVRGRRHRRRGHVRAAVRRGDPEHPRHVSAARQPARRHAPGLRGNGVPGGRDQRGVEPDGSRARPARAAPRGHPRHRPALFSSRRDRAHPRRIPLFDYGSVGLYEPATDAARVGVMRVEDVSFQAFADAAADTFTVAGDLRVSWSESVARSVGGRRPCVSARASRRADPCPIAAGH